MAWHEFNQDGLRGMTGDDPLDEFALALKRIVRAYESRFSRKPTMAELTHALKAVVAANPAKFISDAAPLEQTGAAPPSSPSAAPVDPALYEGVFADKPLPAHHLVQRKAPGGRKNFVTVINVPTLEVQGRTLECEFETLADDLGDADVQMLVIHCLLKEYYEDDFRAQADDIEFHNRKTGRRWKVEYPE